MSYAPDHCRDIAKRMQLAMGQFVRTLQTLGGINQEQAEAVFEIYRKARLLERDLVNVTYRVKHGGLLDRAFIRASVPAELIQED